MDRATSPVVGVALLVALTVMTATAFGTVTVGLDTPSSPPTAAVSLAVDADTDTLALRHQSGAAIDLTEVRFVVTIADRPLEHQPPVPFFAAEGFQSGPTGPFNSAGDRTWSAGERGTVRLAGTNAPLPVAGDAVTVRLTQDGYTVSTVRAVAT
jgi:flagellin-like protein